MHTYSYIFILYIHCLSTGFEIFRENKPRKLFGECPGRPLKILISHMLELVGNFVGLVLSPIIGGQDPAAPLRDKCFLSSILILRLWEFHNKPLEEAVALTGLF